MPPSNRTRAIGAAISLRQRFAAKRPHQAVPWTLLTVGAGGAIFTIITQTVLSDDPLSQAFYVGTMLWLICTASLWLGVGYAALAGLIASSLSRIVLGHISIDQELFVLIMVGITCAYGRVWLRRSYAVVALPWIALPFLNNEDSQLAALGVTLSSGVVVLAYLMGRLFRRLKQDRDRTRTELRTHEERYRRERRLLARELHDNVVSDLSVIAMTTQRLDTPENGTHLGEEKLVLHRAVTRVIGQLGHLVNLLEDDEPLPESGAPASLTLTGALQRFQDEMTNAGVLSTIEVTSNVDTLPTTAQSAVYHILKEAVTNVIKYGAISEDGEPTCHLRCAVEQDTVELTVRNRIAKERRESSHSTGIGVSILIERAEAFDADVQVGHDGPHHWNVHVANLRVH